MENNELGKRGDRIAICMYIYIYFFFYTALCRHNDPEFKNQCWRSQKGCFFLPFDVVCFKRKEKMLGIIMLQCVSAAVQKVNHNEHINSELCLNVFCISEQYSCTCFTVCFFRLCISLYIFSVSFLQELKYIRGHYMILTYFNLLTYIQRLFLK